MMMIITNGDYKPDLFTLDKIAMGKLPGDKADKKNMGKFLQRTVFNENFDKENYYVV